MAAPFDVVTLQSPDGYRLIHPAAPVSARQLHGGFSHAGQVGEADARRGAEAQRTTAA
jgi:hypothetical protein